MNHAHPAPPLLLPVRRIPLAEFLAIHGDPSLRHPPGVRSPMSQAVAHLAARVRFAAQIQCEPACTATIPGLTYDVRVIDPDGIERTQPTRAPNKVPVEGLNYLLDVGLHNGSQIATWYIALFEGNYTPTNDVTAATFAQAATECTAYQGNTRLEFRESAPVGGSMSNASDLAEFTGTTDGKVVYGAALISSQGKGATTGKLVSIARFPEPKPFNAGTKILVQASPTVTSKN